MPDILSLDLNHGIHSESLLYRLCRDDILRLKPGSSLLGKKIILLTNYPANEKEDFVREKYRIMQWRSRDGKQLALTSDGSIIVKNLDIYCEIECKKAGSFRCYIAYETGGEEQGSLYIQIEPSIFVGPPKARKHIPLNSIRCQTVLSKCLGPINTWEAKLKVAKESGYNAIHFTPIQELGASRSGYSLADQLSVNPEFAAKPKGKITFTDVEKVVKKLREEWGIVSICDIVLNHTANESKWLQDYPESTYSCYTSPHLRPAFMLDALLAQVGRDVAAGKLVEQGIPEIIETEEHLQALRTQIFAQYLPQIKIHEFFQCDVEKYAIEFEKKLKQIGPPPPQHLHHGHEDDFVMPEKVLLKDDEQYGRFGSMVDLDKAIKVYNLHHHNTINESHRLQICVKQFRKALSALNESIEREINADMEYAINNCLSGTRYDRVQHDGPRIKVINMQYPLFISYFRKTNCEGKSIKEIEDAMFSDAGKLFMAHNGWVMGGNPLKDFAAPQSAPTTVYFRRELIAWGDSVKLRYGLKPSDSPYLWEHMRKYVETTAKIFDGVRLDNCHSTPLHVAEYLLDCARYIRICQSSIFKR